VVECEQVSDQRQIAGADRVAALEEAVLEATERARDERNVQLQPEAFVPLVAEHELRDRAVEVLAEARDLLTVQPLGGIVRELLADAGAKSGAALGHFGGGIDRTDVASDGWCRAQERHGSQHAKDHAGLLCAKSR
jgi:hypothetical protein